MHVTLIEVSLGTGLIVTLIILARGRLRLVRGELLIPTSRCNLGIGIPKVRYLGNGGALVVRDYSTSCQSSALSNTPHLTMSRL